MAQATEALLRHRVYTKEQMRELEALTASAPSAPALARMGTLKATYRLMI